MSKQHQSNAPKPARGDAEMQTRDSSVSHPPRVSDEAIRAMVSDAVRRDDLWAVAEFMRTTTNVPKWDSCWVAAERLIFSVGSIPASRLGSHILREFMPSDTPSRINIMICEGEVWLAKRLKDRVGHVLASQRLEFLRQRLTGKAKAGDPPQIPIHPDAPEKVLEDYVRLAAESGLRLRWTKPAMAVLVALPVGGLKAALSGLVDLYGGSVSDAGTTVVTLGALKRQLRNVPA
ncbi:MAG TPA: hypothetical protein PLE77_09110 [Kiritimatiellia bacterium]|nr:hypothetical protein [Kiritimatiellia bacterium]